MSLPSACRCGGKRTDGKCDRCTPTSGTGTAASKGYGSAWRTLSREYRELHPLCELCAAEGRVTSAVDVHHVRKTREAREQLMDVGNLVAVCRACHKRLDAMPEAAQIVAIGRVHS